MIQLLVHGNPQMFEDAKSYRDKHSLPADFGVNTFEDKNYEGLGSVSHSGEVLRTMKEYFLAGIPDHPLPQQWLLAQDQEQKRFHTLLRGINSQVGLRESEIDFAVAGFANIYSQWVYVLIHAAATRNSPKPFSEIYREWLNASVRVASQIHVYEHGGETWHVQIVSHVYGRVGLQIQHGAVIEYVYDHSLACPAERFMETLMVDIAGHIQRACGL